MVALPHRKHVSPGVYLERERDAEIRSEYDNGFVVAMAGASFAHNIICTNLVVALSPHLRNVGCLAAVSDLRVRLKPTNRYY